ncbi:ABC transporter ATP-binding protein [Halorubrum gandharaense]
MTDHTVPNDGNGDDIPAETDSVSEPLLSVRNLRTTFKTDKETIRAVDGVSFEVARRETLAVVGESGSGKSVTARSILGLIDDSGRVHAESSIRYHDPAFVQSVARNHPDAIRYVDESGEADAPHDGSATGNAFVTLQEATGSGSDVEVERGYVDLVTAPQAVGRSIRGREIAMVFQDAMDSLNPVYTVGNQIKELLNTHRGLSGSEATETAVELLESVGIPDPRRRLREYPHQYSGGMQQRATIALALACDPEVLVCDEPTTALDVTIQAQILELLEDLQRERDLAVVFITHDMGVVARIADTVSVMYAGELVESAPVSPLFNDPKHPYTKGLLRSIPGLAAEGEWLPTIEGSVPTPTEPATDCRYAPRCPKAFDACEAVHPTLVPAGGEETAADDLSDHDNDDHQVACLLYPEDESESSRLDRHRAADGRTGSQRSEQAADREVSDR